MEGPVVTTEQTAGTDLHTRIREALQDRIDRARAGCSDVHGWCGDACYEYRADTSPAAEIRRAEAGLRTLDRHARRVSTYVLHDGDKTVVDCHYCDDRHPCAEVRELAAGEGLEP